MTDGMKTERKKNNKTEEETNTIRIYLFKYFQL